MIRSLFLLVLLMGSSQAGALDWAQNLDLLAGSPVQWLADLNRLMAGSGIYGAISKAAYSVAIAGFFVRLWAELGKGSHAGMRGVIVQAVGVAAMLSMVGPINVALVNSWNGTYQGANAKFAGSLNDEVLKSGESFGALVQNVGKVATVAAVGSGAVVKGLAGAAGAVEGVTVKGVGKSMLSAMGSKISSAAMFLNGFVVFYSAIISISGFIILAIGYVLPLAIALTMWGQVTPLWSCVGSALGAIMIAAFMPVLAYAAIDKAFVQPAKVAQHYTDKINLTNMVGIGNAQGLAQDTAAMIRSEQQKCASQQSREIVMDCLDPDKSGITEKVFRDVIGLLTPGVSALINMISDAISGLVGIIIQIVLSIFYFIAALIFIGGASQFLTTILGGAASYAGAVVKGRN